MNRTSWSALAAALLAFVAPATFAQGDWPAKNIVWVVPFPAGGGTDVFARPLSAQLTKQLNRQIVIDNRGGAGGNLGATIAARAAGDGYTFLVGAVHHTIAPSVYSKLDYSLEQDLVPITGVAYVPQVIVVNPKRIQATTVKELIALAQAQPSKLIFASAGAGTAHHLAGELFQQATKTQLLHVPYKGAGPAMTDLVGGQVDMMFDGLGTSASQIKGGAIRALAVAAPKRSPAIPDVPTTAEAGLPAFVMSTWYGLWAPKGTPPAIIDRMQKEVAAALATKELRDYWAAQGAAPGGEPVAEFTKFVRSETERWAKIAKESGAKVD